MSRAPWVFRNIHRKRRKRRAPYARVATTLNTYSPEDSSSSTFPGMVRRPSGSFAPFPLALALREMEQRAPRSGKPGCLDCSPRREGKEHTSELQSRGHLVCPLLLEKRKITTEPKPSH